MSIDEDNYNSEPPQSTHMLSAIETLKAQRDGALACCAGLLGLLHTHGAELDGFLTDVGPRAKIERKDGKYLVTTQEMGS
jgi:hypothetical protein